MKFNPSILIAIFILLLILVGLSYMLPFAKKPQQPKIVETQDFSCPGMTGFTFKYPLFENWTDVEVKSTAKDNCDVEIGWSGFAEIPPASPPELKEPIKPASVYIKVIKIANEKSFKDGIFLDEKRLSNPQNVKYVYKDETATGNWADFFANGFVVKVQAIGTSQNYGFDKDFFWKTVIESFQLLNPN